MTRRGGPSAGQPCGAARAARHVASLPRTAEGISRLLLRCALSPRCCGNTEHFKPGWERGPGGCRLREERRATCTLCQCPDTNAASSTYTLVAATVVSARAQFFPDTILCSTQRCVRCTWRRMVGPKRHRRAALLLSERRQTGTQPLPPSLRPPLLLSPSRKAPSCTRLLARGRLPSGCDVTEKSTRLLALASEFIPTRFEPSSGLSLPEKKRRTLPHAMPPLRPRSQPSLFFPQRRRISILKKIRCSTTRPPTLVATMRSAALTARVSAEFGTLHHNTRLLGRFSSVVLRDSCHFVHAVLSALLCKLVPTELCDDCGTRHKPDSYDVITCTTCSRGTCCGGWGRCYQCHDVFCTRCEDSAASSGAPDPLVRCFVDDCCSDYEYEAVCCVSCLPDTKELTACPRCAGAVCIWCAVAAAKRGGECPLCRRGGCFTPSEGKRFARLIKLCVAPTGARGARAKEAARNGKSQQELPPAKAAAAAVAAAAADAAAAALIAAEVAAAAAAERKREKKRAAWRRERRRPKMRRRTRRVRRGRAVCRLRDAPPPPPPPRPPHPLP